MNFIDRKIEIQNNRNLEFQSKYGVFKCGCMCHILNEASVICCSCCCDFGKFPKPIDMMKYGKYNYSTGLVEKNE